MKSSSPSLKGNPTQMPKDIEREVLEILASDDEVDGFAETILYDIAQNKLEEQKDYLASGWSSIKLFIAWMGGYKVENFNWGPPTNLRHSCSGRKAVKAFSKHILRPMLVSKKEFSEEEIQEITEKEIGPLIQDAIKNPQPVSSLNQCP